MNYKVFKAVWLIFIFTGIVLAQKNQLQISGETQKLPNEIVGMRDLTGRYCAVIKVLSNLEGLKYKSFNGIVKVDDSPGQDLVYVSANERVLEAYHSEYAPTKIILSEVGINLDEREVWELQLTGEKKYPVYIITDPEDATLYFDGQEHNSDGTVEVVLGDHILKIEKYGYRTIYDTIQVKKTMPPLKYELEEIELAQVRITSQPTGAEIKINGIDKGKTDRGLWLFPDDYVIELKLTGYKSISDSIKIEEGKVNTFNFQFNKAVESGYLTITTTPADATLMINKDKYTNMEKIRLGAGNYKIEIIKPGYKRISEWIQIRENQEFNKAYDLEMISGGLRFSISPLNASVSMSREGKVIEEWIGMQQFNTLPAGLYTFHCNAKGFKELVEEGVVQEDKILEMDLQLQKAKKRTLFTWMNEHRLATALIGAGITAGSAAVFFMSQSGDSGGDPLPSIDDIWPPE